MGSLCVLPMAFPTALSTKAELGTVCDRAAPVIVADSCCKHRGKGHACGDRCISRGKACLKGSGRACD